MRTWKAAERALRREGARSLRELGREHRLPLLIAAGGARPDVVIALGGLDPAEPMDTMAGLAVLAGGWAPSRVLVGVLWPSETRRGGLLACCDARRVPDGVLEVCRVWGWTETGRRVLWHPAEMCQWWSPRFLSALAATILARGRARTPDALSELLDWAAASGHRVRLGPRAAARARVRSG